MIKHPTAGRGLCAIKTIWLDTRAESFVARCVLAGCALRPVGRRIVAPVTAEVMKVGRVLCKLHVKTRKDPRLDRIEPLEKMLARILTERGRHLKALFPTQNHTRP
jgi:hypothetical protein